MKELKVYVPQDGPYGLEPEEGGEPVEEETCYLKSEVDNAIAELKAENERLKRALWLARANRADGQFFYWCTRFAVESGFTKADIRGYTVNTKRRLRMIREWIAKWQNVKIKCQAKAEKYK